MMRIQSSCIRIKQAGPGRAGGSHTSSATTASSLSMTDADFDNAMDGLSWSTASSFQSGAAEEETPSTLRQRIGGTRLDRRAAKLEQKADRKATKLERKAAAPNGLAASAREIFNDDRAVALFDDASRLVNRCDRLLRGVAQLIVLLLLSLGAWLLVVGAVPGLRITGGAVLAAYAAVQVVGFTA